MRLIFKVFGSFWGPWILCCCACSGPPKDPLQEDTISYPFGDPPALGTHADKDKLVLRSIAGGTEYVMEIPGVHSDYDLEIPLAFTQNQTSAGDRLEDNLPSPRTTDQELVGALPDSHASLTQEESLVNKAFGVGDAMGQPQAPSYTLGLAKITRLYHKGHYEIALVELNHLLKFFPQSPRLHKMKGTLFLHMQQYPLAEESWRRALSHAPGDRILRNAIDKLQKRILAWQGSGPQKAPEASAPE